MKFQDCPSHSIKIMQRFLHVGSNQSIISEYDELVRTGLLMRYSNLL